MKRSGNVILKIMNIIGIILIVVGVVGIISWFFTPTIPIWRVLLGIIPLMAGIIVLGISRRVRVLKSTITSVADSIETIKEQIKNNSSSEKKDLFQNSSPKNLILFGVGCVFVVIVFTCLLCFVCNKVIIPDGYSETTGIISERVHEKHNGEYHMWPIIEYEVDGVKYSIKGSWSNDNRAIGTEVALVYDIKNPQNASFKNAPAIVNGLIIVIDIVFAVFSVVLIIEGIKRLRKEQYNGIDYNNI